MSSGRINIAILGAGESGVGSAILAQKMGFEVFVSDKGTIAEKYKVVLNEYKLNWEEGFHSEDRILQCSEIIKSPGIPDSSPLIQKALHNGISVISEIEFAARYTSAKLLCITGSNGKTTTTLLTYEILKNAGLNVGLAGNVGFSFAWQVAEKQYDIYVLELSSFQLDGMFEFKADIAIITNITPDHLDRYGYNFQNYIDSKFRLLQNMSEKDVFIFNADDEIIEKEMQNRNIIARKIGFSLDKELSEGAYLKDNKIEITLNHLGTFDMYRDDLPLLGRHNTANSMIAAVTAKLEGIKNNEIKGSLRSFKAVEHRLEVLPFEVKGVRFINDSKATNVNSAWFALESAKEDVVWIAGGTDKGNDYSALKELVRKKVKGLVCLGVDNSKLIEAFKDDVSIIVETQDMVDAVKKAYSLSSKGDVVMLSPACASFDLFKNYDDRGKQFKKAVRLL